MLKGWNWLYYLWHCLITVDYCCPLWMCAWTKTQYFLYTNKRMQGKACSALNCKWKKNIWKSIARPQSSGRKFSTLAWLLLIFDLNEQYLHFSLQRAIKLFNPSCLPSGQIHLTMSPWGATTVLNLVTFTLSLFIIHLYKNYCLGENLISIWIGFCIQCFCQKQQFT